jgi:hypothetical protein
MTGQILFIFGIKEFIRNRALPGEYEHSRYKNRGASDGLQDTNGNLPQNG